MLTLIVLAAGAGHLRPTMQLRPRMSTAQHQPRAVVVHASASNEGERAEVQVPQAQAQAAAHATGIDGLRAFLAESSHNARYQDGVFRIVFVQLGWTVLLAAAACPTGPLYDLALAWYTGPYFSMQRLLGSIVLRSTGPPLMPSPPASLNAFFSGLSGCLHALWLSLRWSRTDSSHQSTSGSGHSWQLVAASLQQLRNHTRS